MSEVDKYTDDDNRFIIFWIGSELFGARLLDVREVVEYVEPKFMPNMVSYFSGVINIRGSIVGVLDLRKKFSAKADFNKQTTLLVCDTEQGAIAAIVDKVDAVILIEQADIEKKPPVVSKINTNYMHGIAKVKDNLVTIIELQKIINEDRLIKISA